MEPTEPIRRAYSQEEAIAKATEFMTVLFGVPKELDAEARERWHTKYGMLVHFCHDLFPNT